MSKPAKHEPAAAAEAAPSDAKPARSLLRLIIVAAFILVIVLAECSAAYLLIPPASVLAKSAEEKLALEAKAKENPEEEESEEPEEIPTTEVELGTFSVSSHQPAANTTLRIDFKLVGTVNVSDKGELVGLVENHKNRLRDRIIFEIRNAEIQDLSDPGLGLIKRRILARVNALLGKPLLRGVVFSDYSFAGA